MKKFIFIIFFVSTFGKDAFCQQVLTKQNDLTFANVVAGNNSEVLISSSNAARFYMQMNNKNNLDISFVLPSTLKSTGNPDIPVTFDVNHTSYKKNSSDPNGSTFFNPYITLHLNPVKYADLYYVWIGGVASPPAGTPSGTYTATITINTTQY